MVDVVAIIMIIIPSISTLTSEGPQDLEGPQEGPGQDGLERLGREPLGEQENR